MSKTNSWLAAAYWVGGCTMTILGVIVQSWLVRHPLVLLPTVFVTMLCFFTALRKVQWFQRHFWSVTSRIIPLPPTPEDVSGEVLEPTKDSEHGGPNVVVEYSYSASDGPAKQSGPLVLKNISNKDAAHNVRVLPITVGELSATFSPDVVSFIEPLNHKEVKVKIDGVAPIFRNCLWLLFKRGEKGWKTGELFTRHPYTLLIEYEDADHTRLFETSADLRYRPWKNEITTGETRRRIKKLQAIGRTQAR
jgi:hypothetical protein